MQFGDEPDVEVKVRILLLETRQECSSAEGTPSQTLRRLIESIHRHRKSFRQIPSTYRYHLIPYRESQKRPFHLNCISATRSILVQTRLIEFRPTSAVLLKALSAFALAYYVA